MKKLTLEDTDINSLRKVASKEYVYVIANGKPDFVCIPAASYNAIKLAHEKILDYLKRTQ